RRVFLFHCRAARAAGILAFLAGTALDQQFASGSRIGAMPAVFCFHMHGRSLLRGVCLRSAEASVLYAIGKYKCKYTLWLKANARRTLAVARLQDRLAPVFQRFLDLVQELMGDGAIDHAMVVAQRDVAHGADGDGVVDDHRALFNGAEAENSDVGLADDRQTEEAPENARISDGESAFLHLFGLQLLGARAFGKIVQIALDAEEVFLVGVLDDRDDQAPFEGYSDADIDFLVQDDVGAVERGI